MMFSKRHFTTIDIGAHSIKIARFSSKKNDLKLTDIDLEPLPYQTVKDGRITDPAVVANKMEEIFSTIKFRPKKLITTIPSYNLIIRNMEMPVIPEKEIAEAIKWEAEDYLPFPVENAVIDYNILETSDDMMKVLLIAAKSDIIDNYLSPFDRIGIRPVVVNIQPMALLSLVKYQDNSDKPVAVIDIGASGTRMVIGDRKNVYLSRNIDVGGNEFTRNLMEESKMNYHQAETYKINNGIEHIKEEELDFDLALTQIAATGMGENQFLLSIAKNLAGEIERSIDFFSLKNRDQKIAEIFITGGGSKLKGLSEIIIRETGRELTEINPFLKVNSMAVNNQEEFTVCIGLGLSEVMDDES